MKLDELKKEMLEELEHVDDLKNLNDLRVKYLGRDLLQNLIVRLRMFLMKRRRLLDKK